MRWKQEWSLRALIGASFLAGGAISFLVFSEKREANGFSREEPGDRSALLYEALGDVSDGTTSLRLLDDPELARAWHVQRLEVAVATAFAASQHVQYLEGPAPSLLAAVEKARSLLEASESPPSALREVARLEEWLREKHREAVEAEL